MAKKQLILNWAIWRAGMVDFSGPRKYTKQGVYQLGHGPMCLLNDKGYADSTLQFASQLRPDFFDCIDLNGIGGMMYLQTTGIHVPHFTRKRNGLINDTSFCVSIQEANDTTGIFLTERISRIEKIVKSKDYELIVINKDLNFDQAWVKVK